MKITKFSRSYAVFDSSHISKLRANPQNSRDRVAHGSSNTLGYVRDAEERVRILDRAASFLKEREVRVMTTRM